jgi:uncharacterized protein with HEPN domain
MKRENPKQFVEDMLEAMEKIERYVTGLSYETVAKNRVLVDEVMGNLETLGEAAENIPEDVREKYPEVPWKRMIELKNIDDLSIVWEIVTKTLPETKPKIVAMLESFNKED